MIKKISILWGLFFLISFTLSTVEASTYNVPVTYDVCSTQKWEYHSGSGFTYIGYGPDTNTNLTNTSAGYTYHWQTTSGGWHSGETYRGYLQFSLPEMINTENIASIILNVYITSNNTGAQIYHVADDGWNEATANSSVYFNLLDTTDVQIASPSGPSTSGWNEIDLLESGVWNLTDFLSSDGILSLALISNHERETPIIGVSFQDFYTISTKESYSGTRTPYLVIETVPIPGAAILFISSLVGIIGIRRKIKN